MSKWICIDDICIPSDENDWEELVAFADAIAEQEPIDIVRCKECRRRKKNGFCLEHNRYEKNDNGYCSYGEQR